MKAIITIVAILAVIFIGYRIMQTGQETTEATDSAVNDQVNTIKLTIPRQYGNDAGMDTGDTP